MTWHRRWLNLLSPGRVWRDIDREMAFHLEERVDELVASGMSPEQARREARRRFGRVETIRGRIRDVDVVGWLESLLFDIRYALRGLRAHRGFTVVAVASLALGIGANTGIFSLIDAVLLRSLPVRNPGEIVRLSMGDGTTNFTNPSGSRSATDSTSSPGRPSSATTSGRGNTAELGTSSAGRSRWTAIPSRSSEWRARGSPASTWPDRPRSSSRFAPPPSSDPAATFWTRGARGS